MVDLTTALTDTASVVDMVVQTATTVMDLFLQPPLIFFTGLVVVGACFGLIRGFFRVRKR